MAVVTITTTAAATVTIETVSAVTVNVDGVTVTFTPAPAPAPAVEEPAVDDGEHWFFYDCECEWCERVRSAFNSFVDKAPWGCPRCESINNNSPICEVCDTDIRVIRMG